MKANAMSLNDTQKRRLTANAARDKAEALLERLQLLQRESQRQAEATGAVPASRRAAARDALAQAIDSTRGMIEKMNKQM